jgi:RNA polymerase sigma-70 factor (ECF subfamily)
MDEQALIRRCQAGETAAFNELLGGYEGVVYNLARRYFADQAEAADAAQEAMIKIYRHIRDFAGRSSFKTWVYRLTANACLDALRKKKPPVYSLDAPDGGKPVSLAASEPGPEGIAEQAELREILTRLLAALPEKKRTVIILRDIEGLSYEEIAWILGCATGTVKSRLARAREELRRRFLATVYATSLFNSTCPAIRR